MEQFMKYQSPFSWRYGSREMRRIWSEQEKRLLWRKIWVALAEAEAEFGLISQAQVRELKQHQEELDIDRSLEIEREIHHDLMAELNVFAGQCPGAGGILHLGATSMDIKDNTVMLQIQRSLDLVLRSLHGLLEDLLDQIERHQDLTVIGFTHLQPAEPTTLGYRLAFTGQDLVDGYQNLTRLRQTMRGKGFTGAVGTSASFASLIGRDRLPAFQARLEELLGVGFSPVVSQTYPRRQEYLLLSELAGIGAALYKFAFDLRFLQSPPLAELSEPFGDHQVGSSAMPFKRNPIQAEKIDSLARWLAQLPRTAWDNAAHSLLERTLDDSANRRTILPEAFLVMDELLTASRKIITDLAVYEQGIQRNVASFGPFAALEPVLMAVSKAGADRQEMHAVLQSHARLAWTAVQDGEPNPLEDLLLEDERIAGYLTASQLSSLMEVSGYLGDARYRTKDFLRTARELL